MECPNTVPLTSASDIKSWTARSPTASAPHSHALNRPREDQPSPVCLRRSDRLSQRLHPPARLGRQHGVHEPTHRTRAACTGCSVPAACRRGYRHWRTTLSHLLRGALHLPEGHPRQQRVHRQSDARCDPCVVSGRRRRTRCLRRDLTGSFRLEPATILAAVVESFSTPESGDGAGATYGGNSGRGVRTGAGAKGVSACAGLASRACA